MQKKIILKKYKCYMLYMIFFFTNTFIIKKYAFPVKNNLCIYYLILFVFIIIYKKEWFIRYVSSCGWWFDMFNFHQRAASLCYLHVCFPSESHESRCAQLCCRSPAHTLQTTLNMHEGQRNRGLRHDGKRLTAGQSALNCVLLLHADMNFLGICSVSHDAAVMLTHQITSHVTSQQGQWQLVLTEHK